ncbi:MAG TPA: hypothetical protein VFV38_08460 [Ktedonobacteraceae bacterium]|nr:hypothetical protein [Ktedonobacteraceae bacterium]
MYHLLKSQPRPRVSRRLADPCYANQEPGSQEPTAELEPEIEARATTEPEDQEPVYTVIGEPVIPAEEAEGTTIVLAIQPATLDDQQRKDASEPEQMPWFVALTRRRHLASLGWLLVGVALVLVGVLVVTLVLPWLEPSATVTIVPVAQPVSASFTAQLVPANADLARRQIQGRQLATLTMSQSKTIPTTGNGYQPAQAAHGWITLYNALPAAQTIPAGTLLIGQDSVQVTTDSTVTIPAANAPIEGQASVSAHATEPGPAGNIVALDINGPCCRANITAKNPTAFTGGQNARSFQAVSAQDIKGASAALEASLIQDVTAAYQAELQNGENLITPVSCNAQVSADQPQGSEAEQVTVSISEVCQGIAYNVAQMYTLVSQAFTQQTQENQTGGYQLDHKSLHVQVAPSSTRPGAIEIQARGTLLYQWNERQQRALAALIAGKSEAQATTLLEQQPGISSVAIQLNGRDTGTLTADPSRIQFVFVVYGK